jgi:hypothetical protein
MGILPRSGAAASDPSQAIPQGSSGGDHGVIEGKRPIAGGISAWWAARAAARHEAGRHQEAGPAGPATPLLGAVAEMPLVAVLPAA